MAYIVYLASVLTTVGRARPVLSFPVRLAVSLPHGLAIVLSFLLVISVFVLACSF